MLGVAYHDAGWAVGGCTSSSGHLVIVAGWLDSAHVLAHCCEFGLAYHCRCLAAYRQAEVNSWCGLQHYCILQPDLHSNAGCYKIEIKASIASAPTLEGVAKRQKIYWDSWTHSEFSLMW